MNSWSQVALHAAACTVPGFPEAGLVESYAAIRVTSSWA
jgi:hypothetical protein